MEEKKEGHNYIFPKAIGKFMAKIDQRTQYEGTLMSMTLILLGMVWFTIYMDFFTQQTLVFKIMLTFNSVCGMFLLGSFLVSQFQAYQNYMIIFDEMKQFQNATGTIEAIQQNTKEMKGGLNNGK